MSAERAALVAEADRALAGQDFARAAALLEQSLAMGEDFPVLLRLAGTHRAAGRPRVAFARGRTSREPGVMCEDLSGPVAGH